MAATKNYLTSNTRNQYTDKISMSGRSLTFPYCLRTSHSYLGAHPESLSTTLTFLLLSLNRPSSNPSDKANAQWNPFSTTAGIGGSHHCFVSRKVVLDSDCTFLIYKYFTDLPKVFYSDNLTHF